MVPTEDTGQKRQVSKKREYSENECRNVKGRWQNIGTEVGVRPHGLYSARLL